MVSGMVQTSDVAVVSHQLTSDSAPELLRSKLVLRSDKSVRIKYATERGHLQLLVQGLHPGHAGLVVAPVTRLESGQRLVI